MSTTILVIGLMVFFAHFLSLQFRKTNIPDVPVNIALAALPAMLYPTSAVQRNYGRALGKLPLSNDKG